MRMNGPRGFQSGRMKEWCKARAGAFESAPGPLLSVINHAPAFCFAYKF